IFVLAHKKLPTSASIDVVLMLIAPFLMYISAEVVHASGVMSVVCGGLYLSYRSIHIFNSETRLMGHSVWNSLTFLLNGFVFLLIGLDLSEIISELQKDKIDLIQATIYGIGITLLLMVVRIAVAYVAVYISKLMSRFITVADTRHPGKGAPLVLGWAGMRGVVSLAAALSIPLTLENGEAFPMRSLILYITFVVIFLTLVIQGLTLPMIIKKVKFIDFGDHWNEEETNSFIQKELAKDSLNFVKGYCNEKLANSERFSRLINFWHHTLETEDKHHSFFTEEERKMYLEVLEHQQLFLWELNTKHANIDEEQINKYIHRIDLEKERIRLESEH
ncbi:MAG: cation:proton antiporter, partial [Bergeyella zoohelcum]|nr:cation:proton antiporter [Bergeyella zoohelcum]